MEERNFEQRCAIKFRVKLGETGTETFNKLKQAYGEHALSRSQVFKWYKAFSEGGESIKDELRSGRLSTSKTDNNVAKVRALVRSDRRLAVRMIASDLHLNRTTVHQISTQELAMRKLCAKIIPKNLTIEQKDNRKDVCLQLLELIQSDRNVLQNVITGDETWIYEYDPETKRQSKERHTSLSPRPKKSRMNKSKIKSMLICFFDSEGIVHTEFVPQGQTVNQFYYRKILEGLRKRAVCVRPSIANNWMRHHDNAPCHMAISVIEFLAKKGILVVPQPPYSRDLSPCEFLLFPKLKF